MFVNGKTKYFYAANLVKPFETKKKNPQFLGELRIFIYV